MARQIVHYGLLSTAQIGLNAHLPASRESETSKIVSISSRTIEKARQIAQKHNIDRWYGSYTEQLMDPGIDAIINSLPNSMHCEWTVRAAEAGKHVLCEKPLAVSAEECQRMIDAANANNVVLVEAFTHRWNPHMRKARQLVAEGAIGEIQTVDSALCFNVIEPDGNIRFSEALAGGALWDAGSYAVYAVRFVMSAEPTHVIGYSHDSGNWGVDTTFSGTMKFNNGAIGNITTNMQQPFRCFITIHGSAGQIEIPNMFDDSGPIVIKRGDGRTSRDEQVIAVPAPNRFVVQLDEFTQCVLTGEKPEFPAEDGLANTTVLEALYESANSGASISLGL
tara:strand:- start:10 stop:1017 length:1008 start_codon:yes stop_codon:yes gene_type:complete